MSAWRVSTDYGDRYTRATSAAKARANVAYNLRRYGAYVPSGAAAGWNVQEVENTLKSPS